MSCGSVKRSQDLRPFLAPELRSAPAKIVNMQWGARGQTWELLEKIQIDKCNVIILTRLGYNCTFYKDICGSYKIHHSHLTTHWIHYSPPPQIILGWFFIIIIFFLHHTIPFIFFNTFLLRPSTCHIVVMERRHGWISHI